MKKKNGADSTPSTTFEERRAAWLARELATHGAVRPPWVHAPGHDPWSITWRMGDDGYIDLWASWLGDRPRSEIAAILRRYGAVPAEWAPWAAALTCERPPLEPEETLDDDADHPFCYEPFEDLRARLAAVGIEVSGEPSPPARARR
jgi:hypothetical protein